MPLNLIRRQAKNQYYDESFIEGVLPLRMLLIPAGTFLMGSPDDELDRSSSEGPQHEVSLSSFFMSKYPVTQAQWRFVATLSQVDQELEPAPSHFKGDKHPVEQVSWYDAVEFCARLSVFTDREYRLPTEAEWEYACRAGTTTPFHFGETITTNLANYDGTDGPDGKWSGSYGQGPKGEYRQETTPVDHFEGANNYGLCDMHGNVLEWYQDHWHSSYADAPTDGSAWLSDDENARRILRGGSWDSYPRHCRSADRFPDGPDARSSFVGFRVVCSAPRTL
jgi:formylglycine-generating enzyme required for sulfatase activity